MSKNNFNWFTYNNYDLTSMYNKIIHMDDKTQKGYLYIRSNQWFDTLNVYKFGKTCNIVDRTSTYISGEPKRGFYVKIIEIELNIMDELEKQLIKYFTEQNLHYYDNGATELFNKDIEVLIFYYLDISEIDYKILTDDEINEL